ncbi:EamA family transporter RarD [Enterococcus sp. LJL90]
MKEKNKGLLFGISAYVLWGIIPLYWRLLPTVNSFDILCYRIVWSFIFMLILLVTTGKWQQFLQECRELWQDKKKLGLIALAAVLITINWGVFIWSVSIGKVTEASLGYYMNPLVNVLLATIFLKEPLSRSGKIACGLALLGVLLLTLETGTLPVPSLVMAFAFSFYGLIKKGVKLSSASGLTIETMIIFPFALLYLFFVSDAGFMSYPTSINLLLAGAGIVTAIPLLLFAEAAKKISYILLGFIQYINPTMMLLMAIFLFHEPYTAEQFVAFGFIWAGIAVFMYGNLAGYLKEKRFVKKEMR